MSARYQEAVRPFDSHILIALSSGIDSIALAHLLIQYGRRIVPRENIRLLHINHHWRGAESDGDQNFAIQFAKRHGVPIICKEFAIDIPGRSPEEVARAERKRIFQECAVQHNAIVLTGHHADDVVETLLWRLFTGAARTHGAGILFRADVEMRILLGVWKKELREYLIEEGEEWREDRTNADPRFLRNQVRLEMIPAIERVFPRAKEHLLHHALEVQRVDDRSADKNFQQIGALFSAAGLNVRRNHWKEIAKLCDNEKVGEKAGIDLPRGWKLSRDENTRWILEHESNVRNR